MSRKKADGVIPFFKVSYRISGDDPQKLYKLLKAKKLRAQGICERGNGVYLRLPFYDAKRFVKACGQIGLEFEKIREGDAVRAAKRLLHRPGLIIGLLMIMLTVIYLKNIVMRFDIINDDEKIRSDIMNVLDEQGVKVGSYIPDIDLVVVERALKQKVEGISWAGITRKGNSLIIDVVENIPAEKGSQSRLPSDLVASENAVIDKVLVKDGQLVKTVGSGVCKGDVIVSGKVENKKTKWVDGKENVETTVRYTRSMGTVEGSFERTVVFEQKFDDIQKVSTGEVVKQRYLHLFSADIPLFFSDTIGNYTSHSRLSDISLAGVEIPVGIRTLTLEGYDYKPVRYTPEQAEKLALGKSEKYSVNFLGDYEIKDSRITKTVTEDSVRIRVDYKLYGNICQEAAFFIKK